MTKGTVTSKGQITIPKPIRDTLGIGPGAHLIFRLEARKGTESLAGALRHLAKKRPVTVEEMNEGIRKRAAAKSERTRSAG